VPGGRYSAPVNTVRTSRPLRVALRAAAATVAAAPLLTAAPALADVPVGWSDPDPVSILDFLWIFVGAPLVLFVIIGFVAYVPALIKGEKLSGGPMPTIAPSARRTAELPSAD